MNLPRADQGFNLNTSLFELAKKQPDLNTNQLEPIIDILQDPRTPEVNKRYMEVRAFAKRSEELLAEIPRLDAESFARISEALALIDAGELNLANIQTYLQPKNRRGRREDKKLGLNALSRTQLDN